MAPGSSSPGRVSTAPSAIIPSRSSRPLSVRTMVRVQSLKAPMPAGRDVGVLGGEVGAGGAALPGPGVGLLERDLVVPAVPRPHLEDALDVHLGDVGPGDPVPGLEQLGEDGVVEGLRAHQPDGQGQPPGDLARLAGLHHRRRRGLAAHARPGRCARRRPRWPAGRPAGWPSRCSGIRRRPAPRPGWWPRWAPPSRSSRPPRGRRPGRRRSRRARGPRSSRAETSPPSWPAWRTSGSVARTRRMSDEMPATSSSVRSRPNRWVSISGSHRRNRGQARVHMVHPLTPWVQLSGPALGVDVEGLVPPTGVVVGEDVVGAGHDAGGAPGAQAGRHHFGEQLGPVRLLGGHGLTLSRRARGPDAGPADRLAVGYPRRGARAARGRALPAAGRAGARAATIASVVRPRPLVPQGRRRRRRARAGPWSGTGSTGGPAHRQAAAARRRGRPRRSGIRFGMTGTLVVDGRSGVDQLVYAPRATTRRGTGSSLGFADGGSLVVHDPRRLGGVLLDPGRVPPRTRRRRRHAGGPGRGAAAGRRRRSRPGCSTSHGWPASGT